MENEMRDKIADILWESEGGFEMTCYVLADDIIAALPSMVVPLVWERNGSHWAGGHGYVIRKMGGQYTLTVRNKPYRQFDTICPAILAANAHHVTVSCAAFGVVG